jgi:hypothetical protein
MYPLVFLITAFRTCAKVGAGIVEYLLQMARPVAAGMIMYASVYFVQGAVYGSVGDWVYLLQLVGIGAISYAAAMLLIDRHGMRETLQLIRS